MALWLRSEARRVDARAQRVRADAASVATARRQLAAGLRRELARPKVLLSFFAAGVGYGWLRRIDRGSPRPTDDDDADRRTGRVASVVAALLAAARIYERARRAAAFVDREGRGAGTANPAAPPETAPSERPGPGAASDG